MTTADDTDPSAVTPAAGTVDPTSPDGRWLIDGNNVMGSRPDGWWRDRPRAKARLARQVAAWASASGVTVVLFFDGRPDDGVRGAGTGLDVRFAAGPGRNAADDVIVAEARPGDTVVTADRGLVARLGAEVEVVGPQTLLADPVFPRP